MVFHRPGVSGADDGHWKSGDPYRTKEKEGEE